MISFHFIKSFLVVKTCEPPIKSNQKTIKKNSVVGLEWKIYQPLYNRSECFVRKSISIAKRDKFEAAAQTAIKFKNEAKTGEDSLIKSVEI